MPPRMTPPFPNIALAWLFTTAPKGGQTGDCDRIPSGSALQFPICWCPRLRPAGRPVANIRVFSNLKAVRTLVCTPQIWARGLCYPCHLGVPR